MSTHYTQPTSSATAGPTRSPRTRARGRHRALSTVLAALAAHAIVAVGGGDAHAQPTVPTATFDPPSTAWSSVRDRTGAQFAATFDARVEAGDMVIDLDVDEIDGDYRVGAIFRPNPDGRGWESRRDLTSAEFGNRWSSNKRRNFRLAGFESYRVGSQQRYAGHWVENTEGLAWASIRDRTSAQFSATFDEYRRLGLMPIDVDSYATSNGQRYASVWVENASGLEWRLRRDMTATQYADYFRTYRDAGYRVHTIESYRVGAGQRYAAIWVENDNGRGWAGYRDMTATGFRNRWNRMRDLGFRLDDYEKYDTANGSRYAGVWRQNDDRYDWQLRRDVDEIVGDHLEEFDVPGMSVAITHQGKIVYQRGFGHQDIDAGVWMHGSTVTRLASVSKAITGILGFDVIGDHPEASMDDDVRDHLVWLPDHHDYTLGQSLMNRSCVASYPGGLQSPWYEDYDSASEAVTDFMDDDLACTPGSYKYSTAAYSVACAVFEQLEGKAADDILADRLSGPLHLPSLRADDPTVYDYSKLYTSDTNEEWDPDDLSWKWCGGGMQASANDMAEFGLQLLDGSILTADEREELWNPIGSYASGWEVGTADTGERTVGKDGLQPGAQTYWRMYPDDDITIVVLSNRRSGGHSARSVSREIGQLMLDEL